MQSVLVPSVFIATNQRSFGFSIWFGMEQMVELNRAGHPLFERFHFVVPMSEAEGQVETAGTSLRATPPSPYLD